MREALERSVGTSGSGDHRRLAGALGLGLVVLISGCRSAAKHPTPLERYPRPEAVVPGEPRQGEEIVVAGRLFPTGARVVLWSDPGGYDAYHPGLHFARGLAAEAGGDAADPTAAAAFRRYDTRAPEMTLAQGAPPPDSAEDLARVQGLVDQFVIHYDACGTSRRCFEVLHDERGLSCHFLLDLDGTIYQTLDLRERAWHATIANSRSVGIEIAHIGAFRPEGPSPLGSWYVAGAGGALRIQPPPEWGDPGFQSPDFVPRPARPEPVMGRLQGRALEQYDFTPEQYAALIRLTAALCRVFPKLRCDYPRDAQGELVRATLSREVFDGYTGLLGHFHVQTNKVDPGPAFQWDLVVDGARALLNETPRNPSPDPSLAGPGVPGTAPGVRSVGAGDRGRDGERTEPGPVQPSGEP